MTDSVNRQDGLSESSDRSNPILLYDAKCELCKGLALEVRSFARKPIELVALSDPEANRILSEFYPEGWSHDFYVVGNGTCRKGARALPKLARIVGVRRFASLVGDYATYKRHSGECGQESEHDHEQERNVDHEDHENNIDVSRRSFTSMMGAGAFSLAAPLSKLTSENKRPFGNKPPKDLNVHVATVRPDGQGGFETDVERSQELVRKKAWQDEDEDEGTNKQPVDMETVSETELRDTATFQLERTVNSITPINVNEEEREAIQASGADTDDIGRATAYSLMSERSRYDLSLNLGRGPFVTPDGPTVGTTMSGQINHDVAQSVVDFVKFESGGPEDLATHLDGYAAGFQALQVFHSKRDNAKMAGVYEDISAGLLEIKPEVVASVDEQVAPVQNIIGVSSVPYWTRYVESPTTYSSGAYQTEKIHGYACGCPQCCAVGCCIGCKCGCGIGICVCIPPWFCGCCCCAVSCGGGCSCACCYCAT